MAKYEVEIDDSIARRFCWDINMISAPTEIDPELVSRRAAEFIVDRLFRGPDEQQGRAMTLLRAQAMEQAVRTAKPGNSAYDLEHRARDILSHILGDR